MPVAITLILSLLLYGLIAWKVYVNRGFLHVFGWPRNETISLIWLMWALFLFVFAPLVYHKGDMFVYQDTVARVINGIRMPGYYVYLPVYAQFLAALVLPFHLIGILNPLLMVYFINGFVVFAYVYSAKLMSELVPSQPDIAPLAIVLAPVTIFYLFFGTNHVVMLLLLLASLQSLKRGKWILAGVFGGLSCYKFLMMPTIFVLIVILVKWRGVDKALKYSVGGLIAAIPSVLYYILDPSKLDRVLQTKAAIGAHSSHIERFHFFYGVSKIIDGFEQWYLGNEVWFYLVILGAFLSAVLFLTKRVNSLQALALSYAFVSLLAPEPFRLEPLIGLIWLDAIYRRDLKLQLATLVILVVHAGIWLQYAYPQFLDFDIATPLFFWTARGVYLGLAVIAACVLMVGRTKGGDLLLEEWALSPESKSPQPVRINGS